MSKDSILEKFIDVIQYDEDVFTGHLDVFNYITIERIGDKKKLNSYRIKIWHDEFDCTYNSINYFNNMSDAVIYASENIM